MKLYVVELRGSGGMIHYAYQLCTALANHGDDVTLVTSQNYELADYPHNFKVSKDLHLWIPTDPQASKIPRTQLERWWRKGYSAARRCVRAVRLFIEWIRLAHLLAVAKPDIVQFGVTFFPLEALFLRYLRNKGIKLTQICHEFEFREQSKNLYISLVYEMNARSYNYFSAIFFHAEENRRRFLMQYPVPIAKTHLIPMGTVNIFIQPTYATHPATCVDQRYQLERSTPVILFFGILTASKGLPDLLQAFALIQPVTQAKLLIAGYPSKFIDLAELQRLAEQLGVAHEVIWDPRYIPNEEVQPLMQRASVVVYPYINGSQSASIQVAYAFGRPVIATQVGGLPEIIEDEESGLLVPPGAPQELAKAMERLLLDADLAERLGKRAKYLSETKYAWQPIADQILKVYCELMDQS